MKQEKYKAMLDDVVQFCYRIANMQHSLDKGIAIRQVVRHGKYTKVPNEQIEQEESICIFSM